MAKSTKVKWETLYDIGDTVMIDGDCSIKAKVLEVTITGVGKNISYELGWMLEGESYKAIIPEWRIEPWAE